MNKKDKKTNFGSKKIKLLEKKYKVEKVFNSVSNKYDFVNNVMSLGIHKKWKSKVLYVREWADSNLCSEGATCNEYCN